MEVKCIDNYAAEDSLRIGKIYQVYRETERAYRIINEKGTKRMYFKDRFEISAIQNRISELFEEKIKEIRNAKGL